MTQGVLKTHCICLMMYFKNNWNAGPFFFYFMDILEEKNIYIYITNLVCYTYFLWFFNPACQHIFGKQTGYIFQSPKTIKTWTTKHYASLNQWYNTE